MVSKSKLHTVVVAATAAAAAAEKIDQEQQQLHHLDISSVHHVGSCFFLFLRRNRAAELLSGIGVFSNPKEPLRKVLNWGTARPELVRQNPPG